MNEAATAARLNELEADNARLRGLLDAQNAPGELRHRLRSMLGLLRAIMRETKKSNDDVEAYAAHLEDRLDALVRAQGAADEFGEVGLASTFAGELQHYRASEGDQVTLTGPEVFLKPRTAQLLALAAHELSVNALVHGPLMDRRSRVAVTWEVTGSEADRVLSLCWKETGLKQNSEVGRSGFGTTVLTEMLRYELQAVTQISFEADGLRCTISFPLPEKTGRVAEN